MGKIRILVADDHAIVRMGLVTLLGRVSDFEVVGEAGNGETAVSMAQKLTPDVVVLDLVMPKMDGVEATAALHEKLPGSKVLILTSFGTSEDLSRAFAAGAAGAVLKSDANAELVAAIRRVAAGKRAVSPEIENMLANDPPVQELSPRQRDILESITRGLTNAQIALQLDISPESVKTHIARLFEKLGAASRSEAVTIALRRHLLKI
ncbi:MAG: response regulator transcription factor [Kiritimatiellae bacterium]|nr:response regulator transcription factor [Kiritimatiellia bacterium]